MGAASISSLARCSGRGLARPCERAVNTTRYPDVGMARTILVVDDEPTLRETLVDALEADGIPGRRRGRRAGGAGALPCRAARPRAPRRHAAGAVRGRGLPDHPRGVGRSDRHADGQGLRARQGRRARARRRRLRHQAVQPARAVGPDPGALPAVGAGGRPRRRRRRSSISIAVQVDLAGHRLLRDGETLPIKPKAFELLAFLIRHPGQVFTRDQLLEQRLGLRLRRRDAARSTSTSTGCAARSRRIRRPPRLHPHRPRRRLRVPSARLSAPSLGALTLR